MAGLFQYVGHCVFLSLLTLQVSGISFTVSRNRVLKGSTEELELKCSVNEPGIDTMFVLQILRETTRGSGIMEVFAEMKSSAQDAVLKGTDGNTAFVAEGTWDETTTSNTELKVVIDLTKIQCSDARAYRCEFTYQSTTAHIENVHQNNTFSVFVYPSMTSLQGTKNGMYAPNSSTFDVGDILKLTCKANIGSFSQTKIEWERTSDTSGSVDEFKGYTPAPGTFTEGEPLKDNQCGYTRTATITYNVTSADASRANHLAFRCYVEISGDPYGQGYTTQNNPSFYVNVNKVELTTTGKVESPVTGDKDYKVDITAAVLGSVVAALVIIVVVLVILFVKKIKRKRFTKKNQNEQDAYSEIGQRHQDPAAEYEQPHSTTEMENRSVYDSLEADAEGPSARGTYEQLQNNRGREVNKYLYDELKVDAEGQTTSTSWKSQKQPGDNLEMGHAHQYQMPGTYEQLRNNRGREENKHLYDELKAAEKKDNDIAYENLKSK